MITANLYQWYEKINENYFFKLGLLFSNTSEPSSELQLHKSVFWSTVTQVETNMLFVCLFNYSNYFILTVY